MANALFSIGHHVTVKINIQKQKQNYEAPFNHLSQCVNVIHVIWIEY